jgi:hypothetical protein
MISLVCLIITIYGSPKTAPAEAHSPDHWRFIPGRPALTP